MQCSHVSIDVSRHQDVHVSRQPDLRKACQGLRAKIAAGLEFSANGKLQRYPGYVGVVLARLELPIHVESKEQVGQPRTKTRYYCAKVNRYFSSQRECKKHCPDRPDRPPSKTDPKSDSIEQLKQRLLKQPDFVGAAAKTCAPEQTVTVSYKVYRSYKVLVDRAVLQWVPQLSTMKSALGIVDRWNRAIVTHEEDHVNDVSTLACRILPEEMRYEGVGTDEHDAEMDVERQILEDNRRIANLFSNETTREGDTYHGAHEKGTQLPRFCQSGASPGD
jgi:hypothetical protein